MFVDDENWLLHLFFVALFLTNDILTASNSKVDFGKFDPVWKVFAVTEWVFHGVYFDGGSELGFLLKTIFSVRGQISFLFSAHKNK